MMISVDWMMREYHSGIGHKIVYAAIPLVHILSFILVIIA